MSTTVVRWRILLIWTTLAVLLTGAALASGLLTGSTPGLSNDAASAQLAPAATQYDTSGVLAFYSKPNADDANLLPAYRWGSIGGSAQSLSYSVGLTDTIRAITMTGQKAGLDIITSLLFVAAGFIWFLTMAVLRVTITNPILEAATDYMNQGAAWLTQNLVSSGLVVLVSLVVIFSAARMMLKSQGVSAFRAIMLAILSLAAMQVIASAASDAAPGQSPVGSPAWIAQTSSNSINSVLGGVTGGFGLSEKLNGPTMDNPDVLPSCTAYVRVLHQSYQQASKQKGQTDTLQTASILWERAYLPYWNTAQYGGDEGWRAACHQLEAEEKNTKEVEAIMAAAWPGLGSSEALANYPLNPDEKATQAALFGYMACIYKGNNTWVLAPGWDFGKDKEAENKICTNWWKNGDPRSEGTLFAPDHQKLRWGTTGDLDKDYADSVTADGVSQQRVEALTQTKNTVKAFWGDNEYQRAVQSILAVLVAGLYAWVLIPISVGALVADFAAVILMMLLPITLLLLALGARGSQHSNSGAGAIGKRLFRVTVAALAAKVLLTGVLFLLIQFITIIQALTDKINMGGVAGAFTPLVALFVLRFVLKAVGLESITSFGGAVGLTAAATTKAVGERGAHRDITSGQRKLSSGAKSGGNKAFGAGKRGALAAAGALGEKHEKRQQRKAVDPLNPDADESGKQRKKMSWFRSNKNSEETEQQRSLWTSFAGRFSSRINKPGAEDTDKEAQINGRNLLNASAHRAGPGAKMSAKEIAEARKEADTRRKVSLNKLQRSEKGGFITANMSKAGPDGTVVSAPMSIPVAEMQGANTKEKLASAAAVGLMLSQEAANMAGVPNETLARLQSRDGFNQYRAEVAEDYSASPEEMVVSPTGEVIRVAKSPNEDGTGRLTVVKDNPVATLGLASAAASYVKYSQDIADARAELPPELQGAFDYEIMKAEGMVLDSGQLVDFVHAKTGESITIDEVKADARGEQTRITSLSFNPAEENQRRVMATIKSRHALEVYEGTQERSTHVKHLDEHFASVLEDLKKRQVEADAQGQQMIAQPLRVVTQVIAGSSPATDIKPSLDEISAFLSTDGLPHQARETAAVFEVVSKSRVHHREQLGNPVNIKDLMGEVSMQSEEYGRRIDEQHAQTRQLNEQANKISQELLTLSAKLEADRKRLQDVSHVLPQAPDGQWQELKEEKERLLAAIAKNDAAARRSTSNLSSLIDMAVKQSNEQCQQSYSQAAVLSQGLPKEIPTNQPGVASPAPLPFS